MTNSIQDIVKVLSDYRKAEKIMRISAKIKEISRKLRKDYEIIKIMHVCGTHEHTITYFGLRSLLPENIDLIAGPGCPVCIVPARDIDEIIKIGLEYGVRIYTYGDMYRVPGSHVSLAKARAEGLDVKVVYSFIDAIRDAEKINKDTIFFGVGFETTQPTIASRIIHGIPKNLKIYSSYRLTVPVMRYVLDRPDIPLNGIIAPGHVSVIVGAGAWGYISQEYGLPVVIAGFEPLDIMLAVLVILTQLSKGQAETINIYTRTVTWHGNKVAQEYIKKVFNVTDGAWRGLGVIPETALEFKEEYLPINAKEHFKVSITSSRDIVPGCKCPEIILGKAKPTDCPYFLKACTPQNPLGACMVSQEGTCAIWAKYGFRPNLKIK